MPEFPLILHIRDGVEFTDERIASLRERGDDFDSVVADVVERLLADHAREPGFVGKVFILSPRDDLEQTLLLPHPIQHTTTGPGTGFVRKHRYTSEGALIQHPQTTAELLAYERHG